ncbi:MAG TPA: hypothetical protein VGV38_04870, partial [Pyrinomonadaceae bacterium]|nr:hypothetical protein [Pyrinomonadaceae bacterium]
AWLFNVWGAADLLYSYYHGLFVSPFDAGLLGAAFFISTVMVPPLLILHGLIFRLLLRPASRSATSPAYDALSVQRQSVG